MKDSAWYHKLWRKKLTELPLKEDAGSAWIGMKGMLDTQMPIHSGLGNAAGTHVAKSLVTKIATLLVYVLPAAAMIGTTVYFTAPIITKQKQALVKAKHSPHHLSTDTLDNHGFQAAAVDSSILTNLLQNDSLQKNSTIEKAKEALESEKNNKNRSVNAGTVDPVSVTSKQNPVRDANQQATDTRKENEEKSTVLIEENKSAIGNQYPLSNHIDLKTALSEQDSTPAQKNKLIPWLPLTGKSKTVKNKLPKNSSQKIKTKKSSTSGEIVTPLFDYGFEAGFNKGNKGSAYFGAFGAYRLQTRWLLNAGIRITSETLSGSYTSAATYYFPDSLQPFKVTDKRNLLILNVPLTLEYRISKMISLNAGPVISFPVKQSNASYQVGALINQRDTTSFKGAAVDTTLKRSIVNKINLGITGGISIHISQFYFDARYQKNLNPYKVSSDLGSYQQNKGFLQLGIRYKFKK